MFWNIFGYNNNKDFLAQFIRDEKIDVVNLVETWRNNDLNQFKYEENNHARPPKSNQNSNNNSKQIGRNSAGIYIGSDIPMCKNKQDVGFAKAKIGGVFFVNV